MNRIFIIFLLIIFSLLLTLSCQQEKDETTFRIGYSRTVGEEWTPDIRQGLYKTLELHNDYTIELLIKNVNFDSEQQLEDIKILASQGIDLLIVSPNETYGIKAVIDSLYLSGLPIIVIDRKIDSDNFTAYVGADNYLLGRQMAATLKEIANENQVIIEMTGQQTSSSPSIDRHRGFRDEIKGSMLNIITINGNWRESSAFHMMDSIIGAGIVPDVVCSHNDLMALGIYNALQKHQKEAIITGVDASVDGLRMVSEGKLLSTFVYPISEDQAISIAVDILQGKSFEKYNYMEALKVDKQNVKTLLLQKEIIAGQQDKILRQQQYENQLNTLIRKSRVINFASFSVIVLFVIIIIYIIILLNQKSKTNKKLDQKRNLIEKQNREILQQKENLLKMTKIAEEANESKLQFFTDMSHEFKTLLSLISFPADDLLNASLSEEERKLKIERIQINLKKLTKLTEDLLSFRMIDKHKYMLNIGATNISQVIGDIANDFLVEAQRKGLAFKTRIEPGIHADIDKAALEKVIYNLISNAIKYTMEGEIEVILHSDGNEVQFIVKDTGIGIPSEERSLIFNRFYRSKSRKSKDSPSGTGIGLSLSYELIKLQNGKISVDSREGVGSTFTVMLRAKSAGDLTVEEAFTNKNFKERKVLLAEDNEELRISLVQRLGEEFNVKAVENGQEALDSIAEETPDIVISDVLMPVMDGLELCKRLKNTTNIPLILITALDTPKDTILGFNLGADAYITKPFSMDVLISRIKNIFSNIEKQIIKQKDSIQHSWIKGKTEEDNEFIRKCIDIVYKTENNKKNSVNEIAEKLNMSYATFSKKVKKITGMKNSDFIRKTRLEYAAQLLLKTEMQINEIAWKVGFDDQKYFRECFKQQFGNTPSEFRKK